MLIKTIILFERSRLFSRKIHQNNAIPLMSGTFLFHSSSIRCKTEVVSIKLGVTRNKKVTISTGALKNKVYPIKEIAEKHKEAYIPKPPIQFNIMVNQLTAKYGYCCDDAIGELVRFHNELIKNHQVVEGTSQFNRIRSYAIALLENQNPDSLSWVSVGKKDRWPSKLKSLRPLFERVRDEGCSTSDQVIRSILYLNRLCSGNKIPNFSEIQKEFCVSKKFLRKYKRYAYANVEPFDGLLQTEPSYRVTSSGPNGKPKWQTADLEAYVLMKSILHDDFKSLCDATKNEGLYDYFKERASKVSRVKRGKLRKIIAIPDIGNKCRLVAVSDYWTQILLEPIMKDVKFNTEQMFGASRTYYERC